MIIDAFKNNVAKLGDKPCLHYKANGKWRSLSWNEVSCQIEAYAEKLSSFFVTAGDKVGILSATRVEWTIADMAILSLGAVTVPVYHSISTDQIVYILNDASVSVLFVESYDVLKKIELVRDKIPSLKQLLKFPDIENVLVCHSRSPRRRNLVNAGDPRFHGDDKMAQVATVIYTSGTTGTPKGVVLTHRNIMAEVTALQQVFFLAPQEVMLSFLPLAHVLARAAQFFQLACGCQSAYAESMETLPKDLIEVKPQMTVVVPRVIEKIYEKMNAEISYAGKFKRRIFDAARLVGETYNKTIKQKEGASLFLRLKYFLARTFIFSKLHKKLGGRMRFIVTGGAPLSAELAKFFHSFSLLILEGYGLTETFAAVSVNKPNDFHMGTVGKPLAGVEIKIADDNEILVKGEMVFKEYYKLPNETANAFTKNGWFKTGDVGEFSREGFLRITDRKKDMIITSGGKNIAPQMLESLLEQSPYISHAVVFGDRKKYISAILALDPAVAKKYADEHGISYRSFQELSHKKEIEALIENVIEEKNKQLSHFENIKRFAIVESDFTIENGELTPTMKVKRKLIAEKYKDILEELYSSDI